MKKFTSFDWYTDNSQYGENEAKINLYYRALVEDMEVQFRREIEAKEAEIRMREEEAEDRVLQAQGAWREIETTHRCTESRAREDRAQVEKMGELIRELSRRVEIKEDEICDLNKLINDRDDLLSNYQLRIRQIEGELDVRARDTEGDSVQSELNRLSQNFRSEQKRFSEALNERDRVRSKMTNRQLKSFEQKSAA